jgi:riboflavin transporter FmnP
MKNRNSAKKLVLIAMLAAVAYVIVCLIRVPVVLFLNYEPKDVIITIGAFLLGPVCGFVVSLLVSLLEMVTISGTGPIGALMNLLSTCSFACTAAIIYKKRRTFSGAIIGLAVEGVRIENVATTAKTLPDFPDLWAGMLGN